MTISIPKNIRAVRDFRTALIFLVVNILQTLQLNGEVTHKLGLPNNLHTASNLVTAVINVLQRSCDNVHMVVSV